MSKKSKPSKKQRAYAILRSRNKTYPGNPYSKFINKLVLAKDLKGTKYEKH